MDLKFKKLLLLTMQINDAHHIITIEVSTKKIVDLPPFANVSINLITND